MKINIKTTTITCLLLGSFFYLLSKPKTIKYQQPSAKDAPILIIDKKPILLPSPKPLDCVAPAKNYLQIDNIKNRQR
jgi:hypothetical protein